MIRVLANVGSIQSEFVIKHGRGDRIRYEICIMHVEFFSGISGFV